jgi:hypothetical protein
MKHELNATMSTLSCYVCSNRPPVLLHRCPLLLLLLQPVSYIGCALSTGLLCTAVAWVLFDFTDNPPPGGNFSSPRE